MATATARKPESTSHTQRKMSVTLDVGDVSHRFELCYRLGLSDRMPGLLSDAVVALAELNIFESLEDHGGMGAFSVTARRRAAEADLKRAVELIRFHEGLDT